MMRHLFSGSHEWKIPILFEGSPPKIRPRRVRKKTPLYNCKKTALYSCKKEYAPPPFLNFLSSWFMKQTFVFAISLSGTTGQSVFLPVDTKLRSVVLSATASSSASGTSTAWVALDADAGSGQAKVDRTFALLQLAAQLANTIADSQYVEPYTKIPANQKVFVGVSSAVNCTINASFILVFERL